MSIHDWTQVDAGIFHDFHQSWMPAIKHALNRGGLPADYYALVEQVAGGRWPDVLTLQAPAADEPARADTTGGLLLAEAPPQVKYRFKAEGDLYAAKASAVVIRHVSGHHVVAVLEVVSPGNKHSRSAIGQFVDKAVGMLRAGIHLLVVDLFPPGSRDPEGLHKAIRDEFLDNDFALPNDKRLTLASYAAGDLPEAFIEPVAVGGTLPDMPLFLSPDVYVPAPLEATYEAAWETMPAYWRDVLDQRSS